TQRKAAAASTGPGPAAPREGMSIVAVQELGEGQGWVRLTNGTVLFRGARLADGARVTEVRDGKATLEKDGESFTLEVGADLATALNRRRPVAASTVAQPAATPP